MKKLLSALLVMMMLVACMAPALADEGSEPDWTHYDELIAEIKTTTDLEEREALMHQAEDMLMETGAILPIYYYNDPFMLDSAVTNVYSNLFGYKFFMYANKEGDTTLRACLASEPDKLDPALNSTVDGATLAVNSFGGLYTYDAEGQLVPDFATGYTVSDDGLVYTFTLRDGLKWSDGSDLTAKDFEWSWKRAASTATAADYSYMFNGIKGYPDDLAVSASEDGKTFTVEMAAPCAYMLDLCAFPTFFPVKQSEVEGAEGYLDEDGNILNPNAWATEAGFISSGAYVLTEWKHNESMVYEKNPNYWNADNVKIERIELMLSADDTAVYAAYQAGDLDFIDNMPTDQIASLNGIDPEFYVVDNLGTYYVSFNVKSPLFDGKTVEQANAMRRAFAMLVDRQYIIDTVAQTGQLPANTFVPAGMADGHGGVFRADDDAYTYPVETGYFSTEVDVEGAIELLKSAGYEFDANNMLSASTPISFEYLTNEGSGNVGIAECIQQDLAVIGINMTIRTCEWNVFLNDRKNGNYDIARNGWLADFNDPINFLEMWTTDSGNNDCQFGR